MAAEPQTRASLAADLRTLGLRPGDSIILHSALSRLGWVVGGAGTVLHALIDVLGADGLLLTPTFTGNLTDPAGWVAPPVPESWFATIRAHMPPFDPARTPARNMGAIPELFRTWPGVHRSTHPVMSLAAWARGAETLVAHHPLAWALGDDGPMGRFYDRDGKILLLGVAHDRNSSLHLAETRARHRRTQSRTTPSATGWQTAPDVANDGGRLFPTIGAAYKTAGPITHGRVGAAETRLIPHRALVDFATAWLDRELPGSDDNH